MMSPLLRFAGIMAVRRAATGWRLEAALFAGIILAVALMSSGVIFSDLLANASLQATLSHAPPEQVNFWARSFSGQDDPPDLPGRRQTFQSRDDFVMRNAATPFAPYLKEHSRHLETATFFFQGHPQLELDKDLRPRGAIYHLSGLSGRVQTLAGQWPQGPGAPGKPLDVAVDQLGAELLGLDVGEVMEIYPATSFDDHPPLTARIAAIYERTNPSGEFWHGLNATASRQDDRWTLIPLFAAEDALLEQVLGAYPRLYADLTWRFFPDQAKLRANDVAAAQLILAGIENSLSAGLPNSSYSIRLDTLLRDFEEQLLLGRLPLFMTLFLVTGILIYYLALMTGLVVRSRSGEIALLKSRGATTAQLGILGLGEGLLLAAPAVAAGPFLALGIVKLLGVAFFQLSGASGDLAGIPAGLSRQAFLLGLAGGVLSALVFTAATLAAARRSSVEARQAGARPPTASILHRYYLDLALLALIGLLWWQLQSRGTFLAQSLGNRELSIDYTLLLAPTLVMAAAGLITLRLFPWAAAALFQLTAPTGPPWLVHSLRRLGRDPLAPALLTVLVMLAAALGVIGSAFSATLERGQQDQARYAAGADLRAQYGGNHRPNGLATQIANDIDGIAAAADAFRSPAYLTTTGFSSSGALLAIDSTAIADVAWFRSDFAAGRSLESLSQTLRRGPDNHPSHPGPDGLPLPPDATALTVWARPGAAARNIELWARLQDSQGRIADAPMGLLDHAQWTRLTLTLTAAELGQEPSRPNRPAPQLKPPYKLISLSIRSRFRESDGGAIFLGRAETTGPNGAALLHDFQTTAGWHPIADYRRPGLYALETGQSAAGNGFGVTSRFSWAAGGLGLAGIRAGGPDAPIPALVSSQFLQIADAAVGDTIVLSMSAYALPLQIAAEIDYFPTLNPEARPFAIVDLSRFTQAALRYSPQPPAGPNELWLSFAPPGAAPSSPGAAAATPGDAPSPPGAAAAPLGAAAPSPGDVPSPPGAAAPPPGDAAGPPAPAQISAALRDAGVTPRQILHAPTLIAQRQQQPLINAGWGALMALLFLAVALAGASGLLLFSHLDAQERRTEFALLRTLGLSRGQMQLMLWSGLTLMTLCGAALGALLGWLMGVTLLPLMEIVENGARATPPLAFTTHWPRLLLSYAILTAAAALCALWLTRLTAKQQLQQILRMGE